MKFLKDISTNNYSDAGKSRTVSLTYHPLDFALIFQTPLTSIIQEVKGWSVRVTFRHKIITANCKEHS